MWRGVEPPGDDLGPRRRHIHPPLGPQFTQQGLVAGDGRLALSQRRRRPLERVHVTGGPLGGTHCLAQAFQHCRVHICRQGAAVEEHRVRDQSAYRVAARRFKAVSPAAQQAVNSVDLPVHDPGAEDRAGHAQPFEAEEQGLVHGAAQEVGVGQGNFPSARGSRPVRIAHDARAGTSSADGVGSCPHIRPPGSRPLLHAVHERPFHTGHFGWSRPSRRRFPMDLHRNAVRSRPMTVCTVRVRLTGPSGPSQRPRSS